MSSTPKATLHAHRPSALEPGNVDLLRQRQRLVVIRNHTRRLGIRARQRHAVVDVQRRRPPAALGPDDVRRRHRVPLRVDLALGPQPAALDAGARGARRPGVLGEVVRGEKVALDAALEEGEAVIDGVDDGEREALWVLERHVELAVLGAVHDGGAGADVRLEAIETDGYDLG